MKVLVVNQYNSDNLGDKLLNDMLCNNIINLGHQVINVGFAQTTEQKVEFDINKKQNALIKKIKTKLSAFLKYEILYKRRLKKSQKEIELSGCDAIIIGGGQLIKHKSVFLYCMMNWVNFAKKINVPSIIYGISIDSNLNWFEKYIYRKVIRKVNIINVRDNQTVLLMKKFFNIDVEVSPDIAFSYYDKLIKTKEMNDISKILILPYNYNVAKRAFKYGKKIDENYQDILSIIEENYKIEKNEILLTATTSSDLEECYKFQEYLKLNGYKSKIIKAENVEELVQLMLDSKVLITGRMHAMILGLICKCQVRPIIISNKIEVFSDEYLKNEIDISNISKKAKMGLKVCFDKLENNIKESGGRRTYEK